MKKKASQLVPGDVVADFNGGSRVVNLPLKVIQTGRYKAIIILENVKTGERRKVLWGWFTTISMVSVRVPAVLQIR